MKIAGILCTKNYEEFGAFHVLKKISDYTIVLDDNSDKNFPFIDQCDEYISIKKKKDQWSDWKNWNLSFLTARYLDCDWVVRLDSDMFCPDLNRDALERHIIRMINSGSYIGICTNKNEIYDNDYNIRIDGIWGNKDHGLIVKNHFYEDLLELPDPEKTRLHRMFTPSFYMRHKYYIKDIEIYHFGFSSKKRRINKYELYSNKEDKNNIYQKDYNYFLNENEIKLKKMPSIHIEKLKEVPNCEYENMRNTSI